MTINELFYLVAAGIAAIVSLTSILIVIDYGVYSAKHYLRERKLRAH